jgi:hypothetical protein
MRLHSVLNKPILLLVLTQLMSLKRMNKGPANVNGGSVVYNGGIMTGTFKSVLTMTDGICIIIEL